MPWRPHDKAWPPPATFDLEACLAYIYEQLLGDRKRNGEPKANLFAGFDESARISPATIPWRRDSRLRLAGLVRAIAAGRIRRLHNVEPRPAGTFSIYGGRHGESRLFRPMRFPAEATAVSGIGCSTSPCFCRQRERLSSLAPGPSFNSILAGEPMRIQRSAFGAYSGGYRKKGHRPGHWAICTANGELTLAPVAGQNPEPEPKEPRPTTTTSPPKPKLPPDEADYRSIIDVLEKAGRRATLALLGSKRSRWLGRKPRDPSSPHRNRLIDVL